MAIGLVEIAFALFVIIICAILLLLLGIWIGWTLGRKSYGLDPALSAPPAKPKEQKGPTVLIEDDPYWAAQREPGEQRIKTVKGDV